MEYTNYWWGEEEEEDERDCLYISFDQSQAANQPKLIPIKTYNSSSSSLYHSF